MIFVLSVQIHFLGHYVWLEFVAELRKSFEEEEVLKLDNLSTILKVLVVRLNLGQKFHEICLIF